MLSPRLLMISLIAGTTLVACSPAAEDKIIVYHCGTQPITADFSTKQLTLLVNDQQLTFVSEPAASGTRYFNADNNAQFWTKGDEGQLIIDNDIFPLCIKQGALPQQLSARGNEPFWLLHRKGQNASLRRPSGDLDFTQVSVSSNAEAGQWEVKLDRNSTLTLEDKPCIDSMSGMPYPYAATLVHNNSELSGCAGEPRQLLAGGTWKLSNTGLTQAPTITFMNDGKVRGYAGCNRFFGGYRLTGEGLSLERMAATKMMCGAAEMTVEDTYLEQLATVNRFSIENNQLILHHDGGQLVFQ